MVKLTKNTTDEQPKPHHTMAANEAKNTKVCAMPVFLRVGLSLLCLILITICFTWFVFWRQNLGHIDNTWEFIIEKPVLFWYSYIVLLLVLILITTVTWRPFFSMGIMFSVLSVLTYVNMQKMRLRDAPLIPEDLLMADQAGGLLQFVDVWEIVRLVIGVIFILLGTGLLEYCVRKAIGKSKIGVPWWERAMLVPRVTFSLMTLAVLTLIVHPIIWHTGRDSEAKDRDWIEGLDLVDWNQTENYRKNGFVIGFLYNLGTVHAAAPEDYDEQTMKEIAERYQKIMRNTEKNRKPLSELVDNIILVMNESFYDPEILAGYEHTGGDVLPNLHKIFEKYPSGYMYSLVYGGGTANVEFSAYTGLTNYWLDSVPYISSVPKMSRLPGMISLADDEGFATVAIHPYDGTMYKRNIVYDKMGFDAFYAVDQMQHTAKENGKGYVSDSEAYAEVLDVLKDGKKKHMVGLITMQNHMPYDFAEYDEKHFTLKNDKDNRDEVEASFESLNHADQYLGEFIAELDKLEGKTVMIWFGDHAAGVLSDYIDSGDRDLVSYAHLTPYFVYTNFELENKLTPKEVAQINKDLGFEFKTKSVDLPTVTPNCLANTLYNLLGAEKPTLAYLLDEVCTKTAILAPSYLAESKPETSQSLRDYELINYDMLSGKHYWLKYIED